jgi:hypothetical protein
VLAVVEELSAETVKAASAPLWPASDPDVVGSLQAVHRWEQSLALLKTRLVREVETRGIRATEGHRTLTGWLRSRLLLDPWPARDLAEQADTLRRRPALEQALLDGLLDMRQVRVIAAAVNAIPTALATAATPDAPGEDTDAPAAAPDSGATGPAGADIPNGTQIAHDAETALIDMAARFPAYRLRHLGHRILAHVAPEIADRADEAALRRQEARAHAGRSFTLSMPLDGMVRLAGALDVEAAAIVQGALDPLCVPTPGDDRSAGQRRADALVDVCRLAQRTGDLPDHGGEPPQVAVTVRLEALTRQLGAASLDNGERVSAATARRIACDARILPLVLGGPGQVLDAGRSRRLASGPLRRALVTRDRGCAFPSCDRPAKWCDAHHLKSWSTGGPTSLDNLVLLCRRHHRLIHDPSENWRIQLGHDHLPDFIPPPWTDLLQRPQRNLYHPRT